MPLFIGTSAKRGGQQLQIPPLRYAPVGMTKGRSVTFRKVSDLEGQRSERLLCEDCGSLHCATLRSG